MPSPEPIARIYLPAPHASQRRVLAEAGRFNVLNVGRRWGKTTLGIDRVLRVVLHGGAAAWMAPTYKLIGGEAGMWPALVRVLPPEVIAHIDNSENTLSLVTGGAFEAWSLDGARAEDRFRGREYDLIVVDEAAYIRGLLEKWERAMRPTLVNRRGSAWFFSTPNGFNDFWELWQRGQDRAMWPEWRSWTLPSNANPLFPTDEWERLARQADPSFGQEYMAQFTAPSGLVLGLDTDGVAIYEPSRNIRPAPCRWDECKWRLLCIDPGGGDPTAFVALGITHDDRMHVYSAKRHTGNVDVIDYADYASLLHAEGPLTRIVISETGGATLVNSLRRMKWPQAQGFVKDRSVKIPLLRSYCKSRRLTFAPSLQRLIESEVYTWQFAPPPEGTIGTRARAWATVTTTSEHHADILEALADGIASVQVYYPGAERGPSLRQALAAGVRQAV